MISRSALFASLLAPSLSAGAFLKDFESPPYTWLYEFPLPIPPVAQPKLTVPDPTNGNPIQYYEIEIKDLSFNFYPDRPNVTLVGYDGLVPGPTFIMERGVNSMVRFVNNAEKENSVHLHGSYSKSAWDGWADDITFPGQFKDYFYPNNQSARMLWYHDHAADITAVNAYFGQFGAYLIHDPAEDALGLPSGYGVYDIPIMIGTKQFNADGSLFDPALETTSLYGDIVTVNGQPWPFLDVEPRKYRLRFLNVGDSRTFQLYFREVDPNADFGDLKDQPANPITFQLIATDSGLTTNPVDTDFLYISIAERYEVVFDFSAFAGKSIQLRSTTSIAADTDYLFTDQLMMFNVGSEPVVDDSVVPAVLNPFVPFPVINNTIATPNETFEFARHNGDWRINGIGWNMVDQRVLAKVPRGTTEIWELVNGGGGWSHPIHVHLVDMHVIARTGFDRDVEPYEAAGLKDVIWLGPGETAFVEAAYQPWDGLYMFHCHNLIHEDHDMLAAFNVTKLVDLGYNETEFLDPMEERWRPVDFDPDLFTTEAITDRINFIASLGPYNDIIGAEKALADYWAARGQAFEEGIPPGAEKRAVAPGAGNRIKMRKLDSRKELAEILKDGESHSGKCNDDNDDDDDDSTPVIGNSTALVGDHKLRVRSLLERTPRKGGSSGNSGGSGSCGGSGSGSDDDDDTTGDDDDVIGDDDGVTGDDD